MPPHGTRRARVRPKLPHHGHCSSQQPRGENGSPRRSAIPTTHHVQARPRHSVHPRIPNCPPPLPKEPPPWDMIPRITVKPIPRHMNPTVDLGRRESRALHLSTPPHISITDGISNTITVGPKKETVRHHADVPSPTAAETQFIAEAILLQPHSTESITIRSGSQGALRDFSTNSLPAHIKHDLTSYTAAHPYLHVLLEWVPGHYTSFHFICERSQS
ncbi:unnamed protein product [Ixodes pacificus]